MPKCRECGNDKQFITAYIEFEVVEFTDDKITNQWAGDRERYDEQYPPECNECYSKDIEGVDLI